MTHDVFISYSSEDKKIADIVCGTLEQKENRIRVWIAPRDIIPGKSYAAEIVRGIDDAKFLVLLFSSNSFRSPHVRKEMERAVSKGKLVIPFRIDDVAVDKEWEYYISSAHWLDAVDTPIGQAVESLGRTLKTLLGDDSGESSKDGQLSAASESAEMEELRKEAEYDCEESRRAARQTGWGAGYVEKVYKSRMNIWERGAEKEIPESMLLLGTCNMFGIGMEKDHAMAVFWFRKGAEAGFAPAQNFLGYMYEKGLGVTHDDRVALQWYEKAAEQGFSLAQANAGWMHRKGKGTLKDSERAFQYYKMAAENPVDPNGGSVLGEMLIRGEGCGKDVVGGMRYIELAAVSHSQRGRYCLGLQLLTGEHIEQDRERALSLFQELVGEGYSKAKYGLYLAYKDSRKREDRLLSKKWLNEAVADGVEEAAGCQGKGSLWGFKLGKR